MKLFTTLFFLTVCLASLHAQTLKVSTNEKGKCGFVNEQGQPVTVYQYDLAFPFFDGAAKVSKGDKLGLVNADGKEILPTKYDEVEWWAKGVYRFSKGNKSGLCSVTGQILLADDYDYILPANCYGKAYVIKGGSEKNGAVKGGKVGVIDVSGRVIVPPVYSAIYEFNPTNGRITPQAIFELKLTDTLTTDFRYLSCFQNKKNTVLDAEGKTAAPLMDKTVYMESSSGMCAFLTRHSTTKVSCGFWDLEKQKSLYVAQKANSVTAPILTPFTGNIAKVELTMRRTIYFIDRNGNKVSDDFAKAKYKHGFWVVSKKDKTYAVIDKDGKEVIPQKQFEGIGTPALSASGIVFPVQKDSLWGLADEKGQLCVACAYQTLTPCSKGYAQVKLDGKEGVIDTEGKVVVPVNFQKIVTGEEIPMRHIWVATTDSTFFHYDVQKQVTSGEPMRMVEPFADGVAWARPLKTARSAFSPKCLNALAKLYPMSQFGIFVNTEDRWLIPETVPLKMRPVILQAVKENGSMLDLEKERRVVLTHTRSARTYGLHTLIDSEDWDY